jgi:hypothetical protein
MTRALSSFVLGVVFTFELFVLSSVSGVVGSICLRLLSVSVYVLFWRPWFGLDCANADSISDKLKCAGLMLAIDVLVYSMICFGLLTLMRQLKGPSPIRSSAGDGIFGLNIRP